MKLPPIEIKEDQKKYLDSQKEKTGTSIAAQIRILIQEQIDKK